MKNTILIIILSFVVTLTFGQKEYENVDLTNLDTMYLKTSLIDKINKFREKQGVPPLIPDFASHQTVDYQTSCVVENSTAKSEDEIVYYYSHNYYHKGLVLETVEKRLDHFSTLSNVKRKLVSCCSLPMFYDSVELETFNLFTMTSLIIWLEAKGGFRNLLLYNGEGNEYVGVGVAFREMESNGKKGYELHLDLIITTEK
jgi:hypothetical protein